MDSKMGIEKFKVAALFNMKMTSEAFFFSCITLKMAQFIDKLHFYVFLRKFSH